MYIRGWGVVVGVVVDVSVLEEEEEACVVAVGNVVTCTLEVGGVEVVGVVVVVLVVVVVILASIRPVKVKNNIIL